jgi:hypothetical protein
MGPLDTATVELVGSAVDGEGLLEFEQAARVRRATRTVSPAKSRREEVNG